MFTFGSYDGARSVRPPVVRCSAEGGRGSTTTTASSSASDAGSIPWRQPVPTIFTALKQGFVNPIELKCAHRSTCEPITKKDPND
jgi:hypothetical protein